MSQDQEAVTPFRELSAFKRLLIALAYLIVAPFILYVGGFVVGFISEATGLSPLATFAGILFVGAAVQFVRKRKRLTEQEQPDPSAEQEPDNKTRVGTHAGSPGREDAAIEAASKCLKGQMDIARAFVSDGNGKAPSQMYDLLGEQYALGYIFGVVDAYLQKCGVRDQAKALALIGVVLTRCFGKSAAPEMLAESLRMQHDPVFLRGRMAGGEEVYQLLEVNEVPLGLANHLMQSLGYNVDLSRTFQKQTVG